jgi:DNA-binding transcriptional MocR family regulator
MLASLVQSIGTGSGAATVAARIEALIAAGQLRPGERLPAVRALATGLGVSPATVAAGYRSLRDRGLVTPDGRHGTVVALQPPLRVRPARSLPPGVRDLASGNPDPALLPPLGPALAHISPAHKLYGGPAILPQLTDIARADFAADGITADGITGDIAVVAGALDGIERVLQAELRPGDRIGVEDPSWPRIGDLVRAIGLRAEPIAVDQAGPMPDRLAAALQAGVRAVIATPRGQNPTGAAIDAQRAADIQQVLSGHPHVLVIEDDYIAGVAGAPYIAVHGRSDRWAVIRSVSKTLGPDLRLATLAADPLTTSRVAGRQLLGPGWVSHLLQQTVVKLRSDATTRGLLTSAEHHYSMRRAALVTALTERGITAHGRSGLGVWIPAEEETAIVQALAERGWAVGPGERFRYKSAPGIRVTTTTLQPDEARRLAGDIATIVSRQATTYAG